MQVNERFFFRMAGFMHIDGLIIVLISAVFLFLYFIKPTITDRPCTV